MVRQDQAARALSPAEVYATLRLLRFVRVLRWVSPAQQEKVHLTQQGASKPLLWSEQAPLCLHPHGVTSETSLHQWARCGGPPLTPTVHHSRLSSSRDVSADRDPTTPLLIAEPPASPRQRRFLMFRIAYIPESATCMQRQSRKIPTERGPPFQESTSRNALACLSTACEK